MSHSTSYDVELHPAAADELRRVEQRDTDAWDALTDLLEQASQHRQPSELNSIQILHSYHGLLRLRAGNWRAVLELDKPRLIVWRIANRDDIDYQDLPKVRQRRG